MLDSLKRRATTTVSSLKTAFQSDTTSSKNSLVDNNSPIPDHIINEVVDGEPIAPEELALQLTAFQETANHLLSTVSEPDNPLKGIVQDSGRNQGLEEVVHNKDGLLLAIATAERWTEIQSHANRSPRLQENTEITDERLHLIQQAHNSYTKELGYESYGELLNIIVIETDSSASEETPEEQQSQTSSAAAPNQPTSGDRPDTTSATSAQVPAGHQPGEEVVNGKKSTEVKAEKDREESLEGLLDREVTDSQPPKADDTTPSDEESTANTSTDESEEEWMLGAAGSLDNEDDPSSPE
jgi:hypothetical protein